VSINRSIACPVTFLVLLLGTACGGSRAASPVDTPSVTTTTRRSTSGARPPTTTTSVPLPAAAQTDETDTDLTDVDRALDELDRELRDLDESLSQTQEGDVDQ
jgi:hypothetical protein